MSKMTTKELTKVSIERCTESLFSKDEVRTAVLNACRYLDKNGGAAKFSEGAIDVVLGIAYTFAAGELEWVKDLEGLECQETI